MTQILSQVPRRIPRLNAHRGGSQRQSSARLQAEAMLRDMAFVLHVTEAVKKSILEKNKQASAN
jgi:hypothetical protein